MTPIEEIIKRKLNKVEKDGVLLVTFADYPETASNELKEQINRAKKIFLENSYSKYDDVIIFNKDLVSRLCHKSHDLFKDYSSQYLNLLKADEATFPKTWLELGCMRWKPFLLAQLIKSLPDNYKLVFYHDVNVNKYPIYINNIELGKSFYLKLIDNKSILAFRDRNTRIAKDCKLWLLEKYFGSEAYNQSLKLSYWAGAIILKNTNFTKFFLDEWCHLSCIDNCAPYPDVPREKRLPEFKWNSQEQSTLVIQLEKMLPNKNISICIAPNRSISIIGKSAKQTIYLIFSYLSILFNSKFIAIIHK